MKKLNFSFVLLFTCVMMMFTSCLKDGKNTRSGYYYGVISTSASGRTVATIDDYTLPIYCDILEKASLSNEDCISLYATLDMDSKANSDAGTLGFYTADTESFLYAKMNQYKNYISVDLANHDTTKTYYSNEIPLNDISIPHYANNVTFIKNKLFVSVKFETYKDGQVNDFDLYHFRDQELSTVGSVKRVYDIYVRARASNTGSSTTYNLYQIDAAFDLSNFYSFANTMEKNEKNEIIYFRFKFVPEIEEDGSIEEWETSAVFGVPVTSSN